LMAIDLDNTTPKSLPKSAQFWMGIVMFGIGFASNVWHDEILLRLRKTPAASSSTSSLLSKGHQSKPATSPKYSIPYGGLYRFIS
jgi:3-oxo-5-alpha-steroid 4-dehydrogenase 1